MKRRGFLAGIGGGLAAAPLAELFAKVATKEQGPPRLVLTETGEVIKPVTGIPSSNCAVNGYPFHVRDLSFSQENAYINVTSLYDTANTYHSGDYTSVEVTTCSVYDDAGLAITDACAKGKPVDLMFLISGMKYQISAYVTDMSVRSGYGAEIEANVRFRAFTPVTISEA